MNSPHQRKVSRSDVSLPDQGSYGVDEPSAHPPTPPAFLSNLEARVLKIVESEPWSRSHCSEESSLTKNIHIGL